MWWCSCGPAWHLANDNIHRFGASMTLLVRCAQAHFVHPILWWSPLSSIGLLKVSPLSINQHLDACQWCRNEPTSAISGTVAPDANAAHFPLGELCKRGLRFLLRGFYLRQVWAAFACSMLSLAAVRPIAVGVPQVRRQAEDEVVITRYE